MGRPPKFSRSQVREAALGIVDRAGLDELTMRSVAAELGTGPMTLYGHVKDRADLEVLVVDAVLGAVELPEPAEDDWRRWVEEICVATWTTVRQHHHAAELVLARRGQSHAALTVGEALASALRAAGISGSDLVIAFRTFLAVIVGGVESDPWPASDAPDRLLRPFAQLIDSGADDYPTLRAMVDLAGDTSPDAIFRGTVRCAIAGVERSVDRIAPTP